MGDMSGSENMLAVIKTGGKQYIVFPKQKVKIEKIEKKEGEEIIFDQVLLLEKQNKLETGKVVSQGKRKKIVVFKYKPKTRYRLKKGHRQPFTEVEILKIEN